MDREAREALESRLEELKVIFEDKFLSGSTDRLPSHAKYLRNLLSDMAEKGHSLPLWDCEYNCFIKEYMDTEDELNRLIS